MSDYLSIVICTHNPRQDYLDKVLTALKEQSLSWEKWELLLIDNASDKELKAEINLSWHPNVRHIREDKLGLTPARLRGIRESQAETLVFVDDDNVLDNDYLEHVLKISKDYPFIGAWGSGKIRPKFEQTPPEWTKPYWHWLAIREFEQNRWSNLTENNYALPCGAGLCVRREVAQNYANAVSKDPLRVALDRKGQTLTSCGDSDLAYTACDINLGTGQFISLKLTHLIPASRLEESYLIKLAEDLTYSSIILQYIRNPNKVNLSMPCFSERLLVTYKRLRMLKRNRSFYDALQKGRKRAVQEIECLRLGYHS